MFYSICFSLRQEKLFDSQLRRFTDEQELPGADYDIDY